MISGKPVSSDTNMTGIPASLSVFAVPPVEMIVMFNACKASANVTIFVLSETEINAVLIFIMLPQFLLTALTCILLSEHLSKRRLRVHPCKACLSPSWFDTLSERRPDIRIVRLFTLLMLLSTPQLLTSEHAPSNSPQYHSAKPHKFFVR